MRVVPKTIAGILAGGLLLLSGCGGVSESLPDTPAGGIQEETGQDPAMEADSTAQEETLDDEHGVEVGQDTAADEADRPNESENETPEQGTAEIEPPKRLIREMTTYQDSETSRYIEYFYDDDFRLTESVSKETFKPSTLVYKDGHATGEVIGGYRNTTTTYSYNEAGLLTLKEILSESDLSYSQYHYSYAYEYDENGVITRSETTEDDYSYVYRETSLYENGLLTQMETDQSGNRTRLTYEYDSAGNPFRINTYSGDGILQSYSLAEFDSRGNTVSRTTYLADGTVSQTYEATYDPNGNQLTEKMEEYSSEWGTMRSGSETQYDDQERIIYYYDYGDNRGSIETTYTYDERGNVIRCQDLFSTTEYEYDDDGDLVKESVWDEYSNEILQYTIYEYER